MKALRFIGNRCAWVARCFFLLKTAAGNGIQAVFAFKNEAFLFSEIKTRLEAPGLSVTFRLYARDIEWSYESAFK